jgi:hypothetical protein
MEPSDAFAGVNQHSAEGIGVFFDEGQKVLDITESRIGGEFYLEGQELLAMLQKGIGLESGGAREYELLRRLRERVYLQVG